MLIILGGLPATGKTSIAKALSKQIKATYLRIDTIEHELSLITNNTTNVDDKGYKIAYALATENLRLGNTVIADSVNSISISRSAWRYSAKLAGVKYLEIEIICSNKLLHQQRAENRTTDIPNFTLPSWLAITERYYEPWTTKNLTIDTATTSIQQAVIQIETLVLSH